MEDPMVILANLNAIQERHNRLEGLFNEFCAQIGANFYSPDPQGAVDYLNALAS